MAFSQAYDALHDTVQWPVVGHVMVMPWQPLAVLHCTSQSALVGHRMLEYCEAVVTVMVVSV